MTFKEQMQQKAQKEYPITDDILVKKLIKKEMRKSFLSGSQAALSSDLVKGLVEALEGTERYLIELAAAFDNDTAFKGAIFKRIDKIKAALTNYKQDIKQ